MAIKQLIANEGKKTARHAKEQIKITPHTARVKFYEEVLREMGVVIDRNGDVVGKYDLFFGGAGEGDAGVLADGTVVDLNDKMLLFLVNENEPNSPNGYALSKEGTVNSNPVCMTLGNHYKVEERETEVYVKDDNGVVVMNEDGTPQTDTEIRRDSFYLYLESGAIAVNMDKDTNLIPAEGDAEVTYCWIVDFYKSEPAPSDRMTTQIHPKKLQAQAEAAAETPATGKGKGKGNKATATANA